MISAEVLAHSISEDGAEAWTFRIVLPRMILAEFNTHRKFAKNTSSSRAIPISKMIKHVRDNMFWPVHWGKNQSGMQARESLSGIQLGLAKTGWWVAGKMACNMAWMLSKIGVHKQLTNRVIENFSYITVVFTTTDLKNFTDLRFHEDAQPEIEQLAECIMEAASKSTPRLLKQDEWHLPFVTEDERNTLTLGNQIILSVARCASTSYTTVDHRPMNLSIATNIYNKLIDSKPIHASPFEHQLTPDCLVTIEWRKVKSRKKLQEAKVWSKPHLHGNAVGWIQNRKTIPNESTSIDKNFYLNVG